MNANLTELVFILDKSGSMAGLEDDTIGGFNAMLEKQKKGDGKVLVSTVLFSSTSKVLHDRTDLACVKPMTETEYSVGGSTALIDAIGGAIHHIRNVHKYIREEDVPAHTLFVITTDGMENASRQYSAGHVRQMIEEQKKRGWEFIFLGANIDAAETAGRFGIDREHAVDYMADSRGTATNFEAIDCAVFQMRSEGRVAPKWKKAVEEDFRKRK